MRCTYCGSEIRDSMKYCNVCGAVMAAAAPLICKKCGTELLSDSVFCDICGTPVGEESGSVPETAKAAAVPDKPARKEKKKKKAPKEPADKDKGASGKLKIIILIAALIVAVIVIAVTAIVIGNNNKAEMKKANDAAASLYEAAENHLFDKETSGYYRPFIFAAEAFEIENFANTGSNRELRTALHNAAESSGLKGEVYIGHYDEDEHHIFVQWRRSESSKYIGQYPDPIKAGDMKKVKWGEYYKN